MFFLQYGFQLLNSSKSASEQQNVPLVRSKSYLFFDAFIFCCVQLFNASKLPLSSKMCLLFNPDLICCWIHSSYVVLSCSTVQKVPLRSKCASCSIQILFVVVYHINLKYNIQGSNCPPPWGSVLC